LLGRDSSVEKARHIEPIATETKSPRENPPIRRYSHDIGKSLFVWNCVVADAVDIEPVSMPSSLLTGKEQGFLTFWSTENRFQTRFARPTKALRTNSLLDGTGNFYQITGKAFAGCRELPARFAKLQ